MEARKFYISILLAIGVVGSVFGQEEDHSYKPLTLKLNETGSKYVRFILWNQNYLSTNLMREGASVDEGVNFQIRRARLLAYSQVSSRFLILTHFGLNSLTPGGMTGNPNATAGNNSLLFFHDVWGQFTVKDKVLYVGSGLHYWNGYSRLTNQSTLNMMTMDNPGTGMGDARLFPWASITTSDQFARHLGIYAKGTYQKLHYRFSANNARANVQTLDSTDVSFQVTGGGKDWLYTGYMNYNFLEDESDALPFYVGTYRGKKKILSLGAGFHMAPNSLKAGYVDSLNQVVYTKQENVQMFAADLFYDAPIFTKYSVNALLAYYNYGFGSSKRSIGGLVPGSGSILYGQLGFHLPVKNQGLMPYVTYSHQDFAATENTAYELGVGCNWFINDHHAKITAEYNQGVKGAAGSKTNSRLTLQLHVFL